jgi:hypothetical protein
LARVGAMRPHASIAKINRAALSVELLTGDMTKRKSLMNSLSSQSLSKRPVWTH